MLKSKFGLVCRFCVDCIMNYDILQSKNVRLSDISKILRKIYYLLLLYLAKY